MFRSFSVKLMLVLCIVSCTFALSSAMLVFVIAERNQMARLREKLQHTAQLASQLIDSERFEAVLQSGGDFTADDVEQIVRPLRLFITHDPDVRHAYTMARRENTDGKGSVQFIVDADPDEDSRADFGDAYDAEHLSPQMLAGFEGPSIDNHIATDAWGATLSGYAPIQSQDGRAIGLVGIDVSASHILALRRELILPYVIVVISVLLTAVLISAVTTRFLSRPIAQLCSAITRFGQGDFNVQVNLKTGDEFEKLGTAFNGMVHKVKEIEFMRVVLNRMMSPPVAELVIKEKERFIDRFERREISVLFCDLRGLTSLSEKSPPERVREILNIFFDEMIGCIFAQEGIVDKLIGDCVMAIFGAPLDQADHRRRAVDCAWSMLQRIKGLREATKWPELDLAIGICSGPAVMGYVGAGRDYTAIGDTVNIAQRLETHSRETEYPFLISESCAQGIGDAYNLHNLGPVKIKGRMEAVVTYGVDGPRE